mgnify:CR=1 FL=1
MPETAKVTPLLVAPGYRLRFTTWDQVHRDQREKLRGDGPPCHCLNPTSKPCASTCQFLPMRLLTQMQQVMPHTTPLGQPLATPSWPRHALHMGPSWPQACPHTCTTKPSNTKSLPAKSDPDGMSLPMVLLAMCMGLKSNTRTKARPHQHTLP